MERILQIALSQIGHFLLCLNFIVIIQISLFSSVIKLSLVNAEIVYVSNDVSKKFSPQTCTLKGHCPNIRSALLKINGTGDIIYVYPGVYTGVENTNLCLSHNRTMCNFDQALLIGLSADPSQVVIQNNKTAYSFAIDISNNTFSYIGNLTIRDFYINFNNPLEDSYYDDIIIGEISRGSALRIDYSDLRVENMIFINNSAGTGGAVHATSSSVVIRNCSFYSNKGSTYGGAIGVHISNLKVIESNFFNNTVFNPFGEATSAGGAIYFAGDYNLELVTSRCSFYFNSAQKYGGAIYVASSLSFKTLNLKSGSVTIKDNLFENNFLQATICSSSTSLSCNPRGGALYIDIWNVFIENTLFRYNRAEAAGSSNVIVIHNYIPIF